jgi:ribonuclease BN (tRNA processing enzyme)
MKVRFLGTNGWYDTHTGNTLCVLIEASDKYVVLDAGNGIHKLDRYVREDKPVYLFLSHFHLDHIEGMHTMVKLPLKGLTIFGMEGTLKILNDVIRKPYTVPLAEYPYPVTVRELPRDASEAPFVESVLPLVHASPCVGYRFKIDGKTIAYCTDTGVCDNLITLARDADLLITECSELSGRHSDGWPHLNPEDAVGVAKKANAKRVALVHFNAHLYNSLEARYQIQERMSGAFNGLTVTFDDMELDL